MIDPADFIYLGRRIPEHMHDGLTRYLIDREEPGGFLRAVLEGNLVEACTRADDKNIWALPVYVSYLYNEAPSQAWGSKEKVSDWLGETRNEVLNED